MKNVTEGLEFLYKLVENFPDGIIVFDLEGKVTLLNEVVLRHFSLEGSVSDYLEQPIINIIGTNTLGEKVRKCLSEGRVNFRYKSLRINGQYFNIIGKKISEGMLLFLYDVTQNIKAKNLALKNLIKGQENERHRIAKEIHDGIGPSISTLRLALDSISNNIEANELIKTKLAYVSSQITEISQEIRHISHDLMPSSLVDFGFKSAIEDLIKKIQNNSDINFDNQITIDDGFDLLDQNQILNIYRITQEAVHNGIKHGSATQFTIELNQKEVITLRISDNGNSQSKKQESGIGLKNMKARVQSMSGTLNTSYLEPNGFEIVAKIPLLSK